MLCSEKWYKVISPSKLLHVVIEWATHSLVSHTLAPKVEGEGLGGPP